MSKTFLFGKVAEPERIAIKFNDHFRDPMVEVYPKLWKLILYDKTNGKVSRIPRLMTAEYQKLRKETEDGNDFRRLPEEKPEYTLIRRILVRAGSAVQMRKMGAFETNERRMAAFSTSMNQCVLGRKDAVLQPTQFAYVEGSTKGGSKHCHTQAWRFEEESAALNVAPLAIEKK